MEITYFQRLFDLVNLYINGKLDPATFVNDFYGLLDDMPTNQPKQLMALVEGLNEELGYYQPIREIRQSQSGLYDESELRSKVNCFWQKLCEYKAMGNGESIF